MLLLIYWRVYVKASREKIDRVLHDSFYHIKYTIVIIIFFSLVVPILLLVRKIFVRVYT